MATVAVEWTLRLYFKDVEGTQEEAEDLIHNTIKAGDLNVVVTNTGNPFMTPEVDTRSCEVEDPDLKEFPVLTLTRNDMLFAAGFDASNISDDDMELIACEMLEDERLLEEYWERVHEAVSKLKENK